MGGSSSKATFATHVQTILERPVDSNDHEFWDELWRTVLTTEEIFEIITPDDVRKLIKDQQENSRVIFTQAVAQLYQVVETPYPIYFPQALNCARVLARLLPFLLESKSQFVHELLWNKKFVKNAQEESKSPPGPDEVQESEPLAVILVNTLFHLLFLPEFTIEDPNVEFSESDIDTPAFKSALMWAPGVGSTEKTVVTSTQFDSNRVDVLRLMTAAFCDSLYQNPDTYDFCQSMWLEVATSVDAPYAEIVFNSLINTVLGKALIAHSRCCMPFLIISFLRFDYRLRSNWMGCSIRQLLSCRYSEDGHGECRASVTDLVGLWSPDRSRPDDDSEWSTGRVGNRYTSTRI